MMPALVAPFEVAPVCVVHLTHLQVDEDDDNEDEEEDDLELLGGGQTETDAGASVKVNKSVRMAVTDAAGAFLITGSSSSSQC